MQVGKRRRHLLRPVGLLAVLALVAAACGGEGAAPGTTEAPTDTAAETTLPPEEAPEAPATGEVLETLRLGVLSDCEGAFGAFHNQDLGGVGAAFAEYAGAEIIDPDNAAAGFTGAEVAGLPIELVGVGCADDTAEAAIRETRRLMEQLDAHVMIGPLSGDESIAVANYAKDHPDQTFINGTAGAMDTTMHVQAPNFFRFNGDGAQWNAGTGDIARNALGWETAAVIMDDYSFGWTSAAGFIAEFCGLGGEVVSRVFPPLNTTDYSSFVQQLPDPDEVDGYFWVVGGAGTINALKAFEEAKGPITAEQHMGNLFWGTPGQFEELGDRIEGAYVGGFGTAGDLQTEAAQAHTELIDKYFDSFPPFEGDAASQAHSGFLVNYFVAAKALIEAIEQLDGQVLNDTSNLQETLRNLTVETPYGAVSLDERNQAIQDQFVQQVVRGDDGNLQVVTVAKIPQVDQTFGGHFAPDKPPPGRDFPECAEADIPWAGQAIPIVDGVPQE